MKIRRYKLNGKVVYHYYGCTYGCCADWETPITDKPDQTPFLGVPTSDLIEDGFVELVDGTLTGVALINDGKEIRYKQSTPKLRILAALEAIIRQ